MPWDVLGQSHLTDYLSRCLDRERLSHALLIEGRRHSGKTTLAKRIAQAANCTGEDDKPCLECAQCQRVEASLHADVIHVDLNLSRTIEGRESVSTITIDTVREVERTINMNPFEGRRSVVIVNRAEDMTVQAGNALLKTLEEPPPAAMFLLLTEQEDELLPTIRSRCQLLRVKPVSQRELSQYIIKNHGVPEPGAASISLYAQGRPGLAVKAAQDTSLLENRDAGIMRVRDLWQETLAEKFKYASETASLYSSDKEEARNKLQHWLHWWRDVLMVQSGAGDWVNNPAHEEALQQVAGALTAKETAKIIRRVMSTMEAIESNANPRLALETMMLNI